MFSWNKNGGPNSSGQASERTSKLRYITLTSDHLTALHSPTACGAHVKP
jgi:hypothetical protein